MLRLQKSLYLALCLINLVPGSFLGSEPAEPVSVKILVLGRTGSGKSTLINNILGRKIASVGHRPFPETSTVSVYKEEIYGVSVTVCDTPGLGDALGHEEDYMKKTKVSCDNPDLVIFCLSMDNIRWHTDDENAIKTVTKLLGIDIWEHSMLVLTFADRLIDNLPESEVVDAFRQRRSDLEQLFKNVLNKISEALRNKKFFSAVSAKGHRCSIPDVDDWMTNLMITCLTVTRENGKEGFRQIILHRINNPHPEDEETLTWTASLCRLLQKNPATWAGTILGLTGGGYIAGTTAIAKTTIALAGLVGGIVGVVGAGLLGGVGGYTLEYIISSAVCSNLDKNREEL